MKTHERFVSVGDEIIFIRHTDILYGRPSLFFVHGLGESSLSFSEAFSCGRLQGFNLISPDNVGYGRSSCASNGDYSFAGQVRRLNALVDVLGQDEIILIGHSLGGILGTLWAAGDADGRIRALVNVEGNLTAAGALFSKHAADSFDGYGRDFNRWRGWFLSKFTENDILGRLGTRSSIKRYYASLLFARPEAFLANSLEIAERGRTHTEDGVNEIGNAYRALEIPRIYYWGMESLPEQTKAFLATEGLLNRGFSGAGHWPMIDASDELYSSLAAFAASLK